MDETYIRMYEKAEEIRSAYGHQVPRQDQLQQMLDENINYTIQLQGLGSILPIERGISWEQLWLRVVMQQKYNKIWDGEQWIRTPKMP